MTLDENVNDEYIKKLNDALSRIEKNYSQLERSRHSNIKNYLLICTGVGLFTIGQIGTFWSLTQKVDSYQKPPQVAPQIQTENVIGSKWPGNAPKTFYEETFYEINGERCYLKIDGQPVKQYVEE